MSKKTIKENFRVVVEPRGLGSFGYMSVSDSFVSRGEEDRQRQYRARCEDIVNDIKRHVDSVGHVNVDCDTNAFCEHCGYAWTEADEHYNGGCCQADIDAQEARAPGSTQ